MKKFASKFNIDETVLGIEKGLKKMHTSTFAIFEESDKISHHSAIILGSPKIKELGAIDVVEIPLKVMVWQDDKGLVWVAFEQMKEKAQKYGLQNSIMVEKIDNMLLDFAMVS